MTSEKSITDRIIRELRERGWFVFKVHGGPWQQAGLPDIFAVKDGRLLAVEVKRPGEKATNLQTRTLEKLAAAGAVTAIVTSWDEAARVLAGFEISVRGNQE